MNYEFTSAIKAEYYEFKESTGVIKSETELARRTFVIKIRDVYGC